MIVSITWKFQSENKGTEDGEEASKENRREEENK